MDERSYERSDSDSIFSYDIEDEDEEQEPEMGEVPEIDDEPGIAVENQLRIKEQSAKAMEFLTSHLLSAVWQGCSKNTYGENISCFSPDLLEL
jgi:hypothetical protein